MALDWNKVFTGNWGEAVAEVQAMAPSDLEALKMGAVETLKEEILKIPLAQQILNKTEEAVKQQASFKVGVAVGDIIKNPLVFFLLFIIIIRLLMGVRK